MGTGETKVLREKRRLRRKLTIVFAGLATVCVGAICRYFNWPMAFAVSCICAPAVVAVAFEKVGLAKAGALIKEAQE